RADIARHRDRAKLLLGGKVQPAGIEREGLEIQSRGDAAYDLHHEREAERLAHRIVQPKGESRMNRDIVAGNGQQLRGKGTEQCGRLTDDDLPQANGSFDRLTGAIRERYGYTRERAEEELERFYKRHVEIDEPAPRR